MRASHWLIGAAAAAATLLACGPGNSSSEPLPPEDADSASHAGQPEPPEPEPPAPEPPEQPEPAGPGWVTLHAEDFESLPALDGAWTADPVPDDGPFSDAGSYFTAQGVIPPKAWRAQLPFGQDAWLTAESYTRSSSTPFGALLSVVPDPQGGANHVLRLSSPAHTDATVIRSSEPLPARYRISLRVGFPSFGSGLPGLNGYSGGETAEPWSHDDATRQNGFYWLAILDAQPRPHNNTWIHHHRKLVVDSDNHYPAWMEVFDGRGFVSSGEHPVMMFALDGRGPVDDRTGPPFFSYANGAWQPSGAIRAVDSYLPDQWYTVALERFDDRFTLEVSGRFKYGGLTTYRSTIDAAAHGVLHFGTWPDWLMFGDPHNNYYEGQVDYDDVRLEVWR